MLYRGLGTLQSSKNNWEEKQRECEGTWAPSRNTLERWGPGTGETAQCLRAVVARAQDLGLIPTQRFTTDCISSSRRSNASMDSKLTHSQIHACRENTHKIKWENLIVKMWCSVTIDPPGIYRVQLCCDSLLHFTCETIFVWSLGTSKHCNSS